MKLINGCATIIVIFFGLMILVGTCESGDVRKELRARQERFEARQRSIRSKENIKNKKEVDEKVYSFLKLASPELLAKLDEIKLENIKLFINIKKLKKLKRNFPDQSQLIDKRIIILKSVSKRYTESIDIINSEARTSYVLYKIDEIGGKKSFQKSSARLINKAEESIKYAQQMRTALEELTKH